MLSISRLNIIATSLVSCEDLQKIVLEYKCNATAHLFLSVYKDTAAIVEQMPIAMNGGCGEIDVMLPVQTESFDAVWKISDKSGNVLTQTKAYWKKPREWTLYAMVSSHTDIGLHNSQYIQRHNSSKFVDKAAVLSDQTEAYEENNKYRYTMEGTWFWNNYGMDRGKAAADRIVRDYIKKGKLGICSGLAGNHIQTYGLEEMCRSTYEKRMLEDKWNVESETLSMIDNNGLPWSMIAPYVDAGYKNIIFAPNQWNPNPSKVWKKSLVGGEIWNTNASGGGARIDVRYTSDLPMVFDWEDANGKKITVWSSTQYEWGGVAFGLYPRPKHAPFESPQDLLYYTEEKMVKQLEMLESKYPYDIWLFGCYGDDQEPNTFLLEQIIRWNKKWKWPCLRTLGDPNEPFRLLRARFKDQIPVVRGDITGGWYQHPLTVPELMSQKFEIDRALPNAEKWATVAAITDKNYTYPATDFRRAWDYLLFNDEHSYGTSGYQGRRVYETWMQHRDWINKAEKTAKNEEASALCTIASHIKATKDSTVVFNPTAQERTELIVSCGEKKHALATIPPFGYRALTDSDFAPIASEVTSSELPPAIENNYYKITFSENGAMSSIYDKALCRELLDTANEFRANELIYTKDNHQSFVTPAMARFEIVKSDNLTKVIAKALDSNTGAEIMQTVSLPNHEKRIDIDNRLYHVREMYNRNRYYRYMYYAFPFMVENCRRLCHLNGTLAEYAKDVTGHGTDVYMAVNEWCCSENDKFGVALMMKDAHIIEFDHIHPDKTDFGDTGDGSQMFSYVANDWLQMHTSGGDHLNFRFRYSITSYEGGYQSAGIPQMAERYVNPVSTVHLSAQDGTLPEKAYTFMSFDNNLRFICLKRADDGQGMIARFYGESDKATNSEFDIEPSTVDERPAASPTKNGFITYRIGKNDIRINTREPLVTTTEKDVPSPIGAIHTGLITTPCAGSGENEGHLYLLWGANRDADFSHYKLYRSEQSGFVPSEDTFVANVLPEEYVVGRYEDTGLKEHTCYYYRVCAVNTKGVCGKMSEEFSAYTKETLPQTEEKQ